MRARIRIRHMDRLYSMKAIEFFEWFDKQIKTQRDQNLNDNQIFCYEFPDNIHQVVLRPAKYGGNYDFWFKNMTIGDVITEVNELKRTKIFPKYVESILQLT